jgi:hypothetical protein
MAKETTPMKSVKYSIIPQIRHAIYRSYGADRECGGDILGEFDSKDTAAKVMDILASREAEDTAATVERDKGIINLTIQTDDGLPTADDVRGVLRT